jgi:hypothetical protein
MRVQPWVDTFVARDKWVTRRVESRVEFFLDGRALSEVSAVDAEPERVTVFNLVETNQAIDILLGRASYPDGFPPAGRLPLLICPCGDSSEGTLTVRLSLTEDTVTWDQWEWESGYGDPTERFPDLPPCRFRLEEYVAALTEAGRLSEVARGKATSIIRVRDHGDGIRRGIATRFRGQLAGQLDWLDIEVIHPPVGDRGVELDRLLTAVRSIRDELGPGKAGRRYVPTPEQSQRSLAVASQILDSPEAFRLPEETLEAVEWLRDHLSTRR